MEASRPVLCRNIARAVNSIVNHMETHEGTRDVFERLKIYAMDLASIANTANVRNPSAFSQVDQMNRSIHSLLCMISFYRKQSKKKHFAEKDEDDPIGYAFRLIDDLSVDMFGIPLDDQLEREHETRLKAADMMGPKLGPGQIHVVGGRPGGGNGQGRR